MAPRAERPDPPYLQIAAHYRKAIMDGDLPPGTRLPSTSELASEWGVVPTTVAKGLRVLAAEGYVAASNQGVVVTYGDTATYGPRDRLAALRRTGRISPLGDRSTILSAEVVPAPDHVAAAMGLDPGARVIRRERIARHGDRTVQHSVSWLPADLAELVPALLATEPIPGGTAGAIHAATGRRVTSDRYRHCARLASAAEAATLGLAVPSALLSGDNTWYDSAGLLLEYGQSLTAPGLWVTTER
jgi:DNA-binding GntR family transcriptional regulator